MTIPNGVIGDGNQKLAWVAAIANPAAPALAELNAGTSIDLSCYLSVLTPSTEEATVTDNRLCTVQNIEAPGRITETLEVTYVYDPQNLVPSQNQAYNTLKRLTLGFIVWRGGKDFSTAFIAGDKLDVFPVNCGFQRKQVPEENTTFKVTQKLFVRGPVRRDVAAV